MNLEPLPTAISPAAYVKAYAQMVSAKVDDGWDPYLLSFMFENILGNERRVFATMEREAQRVYVKLLTRIVRKPRSPEQFGNLPFWIGCPDFPVPKHHRQDIRYAAVNDGKHLHFVALMPPVSRMREPLDEHIEDRQGWYTKSPLWRIHAKPIDEAADYVTRYAMKSYERGRIGSDNVILFPRSISELGEAGTGRFRD